MHCCIILLFAVIKFSRASFSVYVVPSSLPSSEQDGSLQHPFSTVEQARDYLRVNPSFRRVALYPTYHFVGQHTLTFDERDHGIIITRMTDDERDQIRRQDLVELDYPVISGGVRLTEWFNDKGIWSVLILGSLPTVNQLFVDGRRALRSRWPSTGFFTYEKPLDNRTRLAYQGFVYREHQFDNISLSSSSPTEFIVYHSLTTSRHFFARIQAQNRTVLFSNPSLSVIGNTSIAQQAGQRFHLENIREAMLVQEGSFYFDSQKRMLYYHARSNEDPKKTVIILPLMETIVSIVNGTKIEWNSIGIEHSAWMATTMNRSSPIDGRAAADYLKDKMAAIYMRDSYQIKLNNVDIVHTGGYAVQIDQGCKEITIENSRMYDLGAGGVRMGVGSENEIPQEGIVEHVIVQNCTLFDSGQIFPMGVPILIQRGTANNILTQNTIHHIFHTAIQIGWSWNYDESSCYNHTISFNYIHHVGQHLLSDFGGIYTCGLLNGTLIRNNIVHDIYGYSSLDWGLYLADGTSELTITNTIVYNTGSAGLTMIYGLNNTFQNNILARSSVQSDGALSLYRRESLDHLSFTFRHNIIYDIIEDNARWIFQVQAPDPFSAPRIDMDFNCYFNTYNTMMIFGLGRLVFSEWQETEHDMHSFISNPLFVDADHECNFFNLTTDSPAVSELGFEPIKQLPQWKSGC